MILIWYYDAIICNIFAKVGLQCCHCVRLLAMISKMPVWKIAISVIPVLTPDMIRSHLIIWWESKALNARAARWYFCIPLQMQLQSVCYCYPWRHSLLELRWNILEAPSYALHICAITTHSIRKYGIKITTTSTCCNIVISRQISSRIKRHVELFVAVVAI